MLRSPQLSRPWATLAIFWLTVLAFPLWWLLPDGHFADRLLLVQELPGEAAFTLAFGGWQSRLVLSGWGLERGWWTSLVSYQFIHGGFPLALPAALATGLVHLVANMLTFLSLGARVERALGWRMFVSLYFLGGICGGLVQMLGSPWQEGTPLVGASAGVFAVVIAYCLLFGNQRLLLFFVIKARAITVGRVLLVATVGLALLGSVAAFRPALAAGWPEWLQVVVFKIGHLAHLGGSLVGLLWGLAARGPLRPRGRSLAAGDSSGLLHPRADPLPPGAEELVEAVARSRKLSAEQREQLGQWRRQLIRELE